MALDGQTDFEYNHQTLLERLDWSVSNPKQIRAMPEENISRITWWGRPTRRQPLREEKVGGDVGGQVPQVYIQAKSNGEIISDAYELRRC